ncbi:MAG: hypothetical protein COA70_02025 [Planctomycetota bacterium]|nr:MAG: hypothetical protein COA70_02025 [Planctomycetota bacterium]
MSLADLVSTASGVLANSIGEDVQYIPADGSDPIGFKALYKTELEEMDGDTGAAVMSRKPNIMVRHAAMGKAPVTGDRFTLKGDSFKGTVVDEDLANGESLVLLMKEREVA